MVISGVMAALSGPIVKRVATRRCCYSGLKPVSLTAVPLEPRNQLSLHARRRIERKTVASNTWQAS